MTHWHVETGLAGYGPDAADTDGFTVYRALTDVADAIRGELDTHAEYEVEVARTYAEHGDYESAWNLREHADSLGTMAGNFSNTRADAPLYQGDPTLWDAEITRLIAEHVPVDVNEGRTRIYAWMCDETECEAGEDE